MCSTTNLMVTAEEAIAILNDLVAKHPGDAYLSSAQVCLGDAEDLYSEGSFVFSAKRAHKGISYLAGFHNHDWRAA